MMLCCIWITSFFPRNMIMYPYTVWMYNSDHLAPNSFAWVVDYDKDDSHCTSALSPPMLGPYKPRPNLKVSERIIWRTRSIRYQHDRGLHASRQDERESWCNEQWGIRSLFAHRRLKAKNRATGNMSVLPFSFLPPLCAMNSRFFPLHAN